MFAPSGTRKNCVSRFDLWSAPDIQTVLDPLTSPRARFELNDESGRSEEDLKLWWAPHTVFHLWIHSEDRSKVGTKIVEMFPERLFGA